MGYENSNGEAGGSTYSGTEDPVRYRTLLGKKATGVIFFFFFPFLLLHLEYCTGIVQCNISICVRGEREAVLPHP